MRLNDAKLVKYEDVTFHVYRSYGQKRKYQRKLLASGYKEDMTDEERLAFLDTAGALTAEALAEIVVGIDGLTDEEGQPVTKWQPGLLERLPEACGELLAAVVTGQEVEAKNALSELPSPAESTSAGTS